VRESAVAAASAVAVRRCRDGDSLLMLFSPESPREFNLADALAAFSEFVLVENVHRCRAVIEERLTRNGSSDNDVGILAGGGAEHEIYRLAFPSSDDDGDVDVDFDVGNAPVSVIFVREFLASNQGKLFSRTLTFSNLRLYMLDACEKRRRRMRQQQRPWETAMSATSAPSCCRELRNCMLVLQFGGPTPGQIRHIDDTHPNLSLFLYMSDRCPCTHVYRTSDDDDNKDSCSKIACVEDLLDFWSGDGGCGDGPAGAGTPRIPDSLQAVMRRNSDYPLCLCEHTKYFASSWRSINSALCRFGKLYLPPTRIFGKDRKMDPGTVLIAGNNAVHAGPPSHEGQPRMFAFAVGVTNTEDNEGEARENLAHDDDDPKCTVFEGGVRSNHGSNDDDNNNNKSDGEVQYCPALFHVDLCCILFGMLKYPTNDCDAAELATYDLQEIEQSKRFLIHLLIPMVLEYPNETYGRMLVDGEDRRTKLRDWLAKFVRAVAESESCVGGSVLDGSLATAGPRYRLRLPRQYQNDVRICALIDEAAASEAIFYSPDSVSAKHVKKKTKKKRLTNGRKKVAKGCRELN